MIYQKFKSHRNSIIFGVCSILIANIIAGVVDVVHFLYRLDHNGSEYSALIRFNERTSKNTMTYSIFRQSVATLFGGLIASSLSACVLNWYLIVTNANTAPINK